MFLTLLQIMRRQILFLLQGVPVYRYMYRNGDTRDELIAAYCIEGREPYAAFSDANNAPACGRAGPAIPFVLVMHPL